jgi:CRISPR/Cas system-associated exonuclease Cas4 (RecB family)
MATVPKDDFITASEIAEYLYCQRAWWLKLKGFANGNTENLAQGAAAHVQYSQQVEQVTQSQSLGKRIVFIGIALLIVFIIIRLLIH